MGWRKDAATSNYRLVSSRKLPNGKRDNLHLNDNVTMPKPTQEQQVIEALKSQGGWATLRRLNEVMDFSTWTTRTPEASVRRIVQISNAIFKIRPGLWALEEFRDEVLRKFNLQAGNRQSEEVFTHGYYQGLLVEIGNIQNLKTFVPAQDKRRLYLGTELGEVAHSTSIPNFTYDDLLRKAKTIDVIWFNCRNMPSHFYEIEHTTDIKNSLSKFYELQDFFAKFFIVADSQRKDEFEDKLHYSIFNEIRNRVKFLSYERVIEMHTNITQRQSLLW